MKSLSSLGRIALTTFVIVLALIGLDKLFLECTCTCTYVNVNQSNDFTAFIDQKSRGHCYLNGCDDNVTDEGKDFTLIDEDCNTEFGLWIPFQRSVVTPPIFDGGEKPFDSLDELIANPDNKVRVLRFN